MSILGETLEPFDDDGFIPAYGFGDISTRDKDVFPFVSQVVREKSGIFEQTAKFRQPPCLFHISNIRIKK